MGRSTQNAMGGKASAQRPPVVGGEQLGKVEAPAASSYGMMSYVHDGKQYIMLQTGPTLTAMALADF